MITVGGKCRSKCENELTKHVAFQLEKSRITKSLVGRGGVFFPLCLLFPSMFALTVIVFILAHLSVLDQANKGGVDTINYKDHKYCQMGVSASFIKVSCM